MRPGSKPTIGKIRQRPTGPRWAFIAALLALAFAMASGPAAAQDPQWSSNLVFQPMPSPFLSDWERDPQIATLTVFYSGTAAQDFHIEGVVTNDRLGNLVTTESPQESMPFGPYTQLFTTTDVIDWNTVKYNSSFSNLAIRTGVLPEGDYQLCARVLDSGGKLLTESCGSFSISLPEPPELIYPETGTAVTSPQPVFQWTPLSVSPDVGLTYRIRVVEKLPQQTPLTAIQSNIPVYEGEVTGAPMLVYPLDALPLEQGKEYAWQVEALNDALEPITAGGRQSEIFTFTYGEATTLASIGLPDTVTLVPGVARLRGLSSGVTVEETPTAYTLNGRAQLEILSPFPATVDVELQDLDIEKTSLQSLASGVLPTFVSGSARADGVALALPDWLGGRYLHITDFDFEPATGLTAGLEIALPGTPVPLDGRATLTQTGLSGSLSATASEGESLVAVGKDPVRVRIEHAAVSFPRGGLTFDGGLELFGQAVSCDDVRGTVADDGKITLTTSCTPSEPLQLIPDVDRLQLSVRALAGTINADLAAGTATYSLKAATVLSMNAGGPSPCSAALDLSLSDRGLSVDHFKSQCDLSGATADLGWLKLKLSALALDRLAYSPGSGFDFALRLNIHPEVPALEQLALPALDSVEVSPSGLSIPALDVPIDLPRLQLAGFGLGVTHVHLPAFTLSWSDWQAHTPNGFDFAFDMDLTMPMLPVVDLGCLRTNAISLQRAELANGRFAAQVPDTSFAPGDCRLTMGRPDMGFDLRHIGGTLAVQLAPSLEIKQLPNVQGNLVLPDFFSCPADQRTLKLDASTLQLAPDGRLAGKVTGLAPPCAITLPAASVSFTQASLDFGSIQDTVPSLELAGAATASFTAASQKVSGSGSIDVDLLQGRLVDGSLAFKGPFELDVPRQDPVLSFTLNSAVLDTAGLHIDGRNDLNLPDSTKIRTTFDSLTIDPLAFRITGGVVRFDVPFGLEAGLDSVGHLAWRAVPRGASPSIKTGLHVDLPTDISLGPGGFHASGDGGAHLLYESRDLDSLSASFTSDFGVSLNPFQVSKGTLSLAMGGTTVASIDANGFHPNFAYFGVALLPDKLPLPSTDVAYLQLRDSTGNLLVDVQTLDAGVRISTRTGTPVPLVFPALALGRPQAPRMDVAFDLTLNAMGTKPVAGSIQARVPATAASSFDLSHFGIPFAVDSIAYEPGSAGDWHFLLDGQLSLFDQQIADPGSVSLTLGSSGALDGDITLPLAQRIPLVPDSKKLVLALDTVRGSFDVGLTTGRLHYDLNLVGGLELALNGTEPYRLGATVEATEHGISVPRLETPTLGVDSTARATLDLGFAKMGVGDVRVPTLAFADGKWDFEMLFDVNLEFPDLDSLKLPAIKDVSLRSDGFTIPSVDIPEIKADSFQVEGFALRPLAFRMDSVRYDWFTGEGPADWGFGFDMELSFPGLPPDLPEGLRNAKLTILNAGLHDGHLTGTIEPRPFEPALRLPLGDSMVVNVTSISGAIGDSARAIRDGAGLASGVSGAGSGGPPIVVTLAGSFTPPPLMQCSGSSGDSVSLGHATLTLSSAGRVAGRVSDFVPECPVALGPVAVQVTNSSLIFDASADSQKVTLDLDGAAKLPSPTPGDTVTAAGHLKLDLLHARVLDGSLAVTKPFRWGLPTAYPVFTFTVNEARLDSLGFHFTGGGALELNAGLDKHDTTTIGSIKTTMPVNASASAEVGVVFNDLTLSLPDFRVVSGSAGFTSKFALNAAITSDGSLTWQAGDTLAIPGTDNGLHVILPDTVRLDKNGLGLGGSAGARLAFKDSTFNNLRVDFLDGFRLGFSPFGIQTGRANFVLDSVEVAHADSSGFWPGNVFGLLPLPARIGLPSDKVAYLQLRDSATNKLLIESNTGPDGVQLSTPKGHPVRMVVPALTLGDSTPPEVDVTFSVVVNPVTFRMVSGSIHASPKVGQKTLFNLKKLGVPIDVSGLSYANIGNGYGLKLDGNVILPASLGGLDVALHDVTVTAKGLAGTVESGHYSAAYDSTARPITVMELPGDGSIEVTGVRAVFGDGAPDIRMSGNITSAIFSPQGGDPTKIFFTAQHTSKGFDFGVDLASLPQGTLPLGVATFKPVAVGDTQAVQFSATPQAFHMALSGILRVPALSKDFAVTIAGLQIGTDGVKMPDISVSAPEQWQRINLFGAQLTMKDTADQKGMVLAYQNKVLSLTMSGALTMMGNTSTFHGLRIASDGTFDLASANLLSRPLALADSALVVDTLLIREGKLEAQALLDLPAPLNGDGPQRVRFSIAPDGTVTGGGHVTLIDEPEGLSSSNTLIPLGIATLHPRRLALNLDLSSAAKSDVEVVADVYLQNQEKNRIALGSVSGNTVTPGLRIGFDGSVEWGSFSVPDTLDFDFDVLRLKVNDVSRPAGAHGFAIGMSGQLAPHIDGVDASLDFHDFVIDASGHMDVSGATVSGGELSISDAVHLQVQQFGYSDTPTTIRVASDSAGGGMQQISVSSYVQFAGTIDVAKVFSGGVDSFLFYQDDKGLAHMVVRNAHLSVYEVLTMRADFRYEQKSDGFAMRLAASGTLMKTTDVTLVGSIDQENGQTHAGVFLAAGVVLPVPPAITITDLGGGFFLNPRASDIQQVCQTAQVSDDAAKNCKIDDPGHFAAMLYGRAAVVSSSLVEGRALLTVTETTIALNGAVNVLSQGKRLHGEMRLAAGLKKAYLEGNLSLDIAYSGVVTGHQQLEFYVYGKNAWGVQGSMDVALLGVIHGNAKLFVGPPGFVLAANVTQKLDVWVISGQASFDVTLWYQASQQEWGAHAAIGAKASVLGGAVSAEAKLEGVLLVPAGSLPYLYAAADLTVTSPVGNWEGSLWAKFENGSASAGFGKDPEMQAALDKAQQVSDEISSARDDAENTVQTARQSAAAISLTDAELAAAYDRIRSAPRLAKVGAAALTYYSEQQRQPHPADEEQTLGWALATLVQQGAPSDSSRILAYGDSVKNDLAAIDAHRAAVSGRLAALQTSLPPVEQVETGQLPANPVKAVSFKEPVTHMVGDSVKVLDSGPTFELDAQAATAAKTAMQEREAATDRQDRQVLAQIQQLENILAGLDAAVARNDSASLLAFAALHGRARSAAQAQFAYQADYLLRRQDWDRARLDTLLGRQAAIRSILAAKTSYAASQSIRDLASLATDRMNVLQMWVGSQAPNLLTTYNQELDQHTHDQSWLAAEADSAAMLTWYHLARAGLQATDTATQSALDDLRQRAETRLGAIQESHRQISAGLSRLFQAKAELTGALYDLYDRYLLGHALSVSDSSRVVPDSLQPMQARFLALRQALEAPTVTAVNAVSTGHGYMAKTAFYWSGKQAGATAGGATATATPGIYEFLFDDFAGASPPESGSLLSNGASDHYTGYAFATSRSEHEQQRTFQGGVRGGAGFVAQRATSYTASFPGGAVATTSTSETQPDGTRPSVPTITFPGHPAHRVNDMWTAWTPDATGFVVTWQSTDPQSGISEYSYAIGSTPGAQDLRPWSSVGGRNRMRIDGVQLSSTQPVYVAVRARNGDGLWSLDGVSPGLRLDASAPAFASGSRIQVAGATSSTSTTTSVSLPTFTVPSRTYAPCPVAAPGWPVTTSTGGQTTTTTTSGTAFGSGRSVSWNGSLANTTTYTTTTTTGLGGTPASVSFQRPAAGDVGSGIRTYYWRVDTTRSVAFDSTAWTDAGLDASVTAEGDPLSYTGTFYFSVVAIDWAGNVSAPLTYGPFRATDATPPQAPHYCVAMGSAAGRLRVAMDSVAVDRETGIEGYRYRVRAGGSTLRDFGSSFDLSGSQPAGSFETSTLPLIDGTSYYVDVQAWNHSGQASPLTTSGPFLYDHTPPPMPAAHAQEMSPFGVAFVRITITAYDDPHSGLAAQYIAIGSTLSGVDVLAPRQVATNRTGTYSITLSLPNATRGRTYYLHVMTVNGAGLRSQVRTVSFRP